MFSENAKKLVSEAISMETELAMINWGETYNNLHEAYAVLKEEVEEAGEAWDNTNKQLNILWEFIRHPEIFLSNEPNKTISDLKNEAENLALEAVQVASVCNKILGE